ncbi:MAG: alpha/beta hydrolase [Gemella sp.]|nr:alpha/beta hydrolase [Gemella sp.]
MKFETISLNDTATLDSYILNSEISYKVNKKRPAIIICPGGGYLFHAIKEGEAIATTFLNQGYHAFVLKYSTYYKNRITSLEERPEINENAYYPQQVLELMITMKLLHDKSEEWMIDVDNIFVIGFSAGGHVAATLGTRWNDEKLLELLPFKVDSNLLKPKGLILAYPQLDTDKGVYLSKNAGDSELIKHQIEDINKCLFGTSDPSEELLKDRDIIGRINKDTPPTFIWMTLTDKIVNPLATLDYIKELHKSGVNGELHLFDSGHHGLARADKFAAKSDTDVNDSVAQWLPLSIKWMEKHINN